MQLWKKIQWEEGRIKALDKEIWNQFDSISKLAWDWYTTNQFIEDFKNNISDKRFFVIKSEDMFSNTNKVIELFDFIGLNNVNDNKIKKLQNKPINKINVQQEPENMHKINKYPRYKDWSKKDKDKLKNQVNNLQEKYGYKL
jgi:hypothetical protein